MEAPAASEASKLLSDLESCATELMFGGNETEIADSVVSSFYFFSTNDDFELESAIREVTCWAKIS